MGLQGQESYRCQPSEAMPSQDCRDRTSTGWQDHIPRHVYWTTGCPSALGPTHLSKQILGWVVLYLHCNFFTGFLNKCQGFQSLPLMLNCLIISLFYWLYERELNHLNMREVGMETTPGRRLPSVSFWREKGFIGVKFRASSLILPATTPISLSAPSLPSASSRVPWNMSVEISELPALASDFPCCSFQEHSNLLQFQLSYFRRYALICPSSPSCILTTLVCQSQVRYLGPEK